MATISGVTNAPNVSALTPPARSKAAAPAASATPGSGVIVSLSGRNEAALTYNAAGRVGAAINPPPARTAQGAAQAAPANAGARPAVPTGDNMVFGNLGAGRGVFSQQAMDQLVGEGPFSKKDAQSMSIGNFPPGALAQTQNAVTQAKNAQKASSAN